MTVILVPASYAAVKSIVAQLDPNARLPGESFADWWRRTSTGGTSPEAEARAAESAARDARGELTLSNLNGRWFYDYDKQIPVLVDMQVKNGRRRWYIRDENNTQRGIGRGLRLLDPNTGELFSVGATFGADKGLRDWHVSHQQLTESQINSYRGLLGEGGGVSPDTSAEIASREAINAANIAHENELERLRDARERELAQLQEENANKRARLGEAGSLARQAMEVQQAARQWLANTVGVDPTRAAIGASGGVQRGNTPTQALHGQLQNVLAQPIPTVSESAQIPEIEQTISQLQGMQQLPTNPVGLAYGGTIDTQRDPSGTFRMAQGSTKRGVLTGERNMDGDEEVVVLDTANPGHVEVVPLVSAAAEGGQYDASTTAGALAPIFGSLGFKSFPSAGRNATGYFWGPQQFQGKTIGGGATARALGYAPRLIRNSETGAVYYKNPQGQLEHILDPNLFGGGGFRWGDVLNVGASEIPEFGPLGASYSGSGVPIEGGVRPGGGARSIPLITPENVALPDITQLAGIWRFLDPQTQHVVASTYGVAGLGGGPSADSVANALASIKEATRRFTPVGTATARGARLG